MSYWDPAFYGRWASLVEILAVLAVTGYLCWRHSSLRYRVGAGLGI